jgi:acetate kinase
MATMTFLLIVNAGSSSLKASLFSPDPLLCAAQFHFKNIQSQNPLLSFKKNGAEKSLRYDHSLSIEELFEILFSELKGISLSVIGHRFVHGGELQSPYIVNNNEDLRPLQQLNFLAPLHNPFCIKGIENAFYHYALPQWVFFDTDFHRMLPDYAKTYGIPHALSKKYRIQRYGFHGIAHAFLWKSYVHAKKRKTAKMITVHLGNGCSITAIKNGVSLDTSMGFSPLEGVVMATRSGDIDPSLIEFLCKSEKKSVDEILHLLNFESGLLGLCGIQDMKELIQAQEKNPLAKLALEIFCYRIIKTIGAYVSVLEGIDVIIFSGGMEKTVLTSAKKFLRASTG